MSSADQWRWTDEEGVQRLLRGDELRSALTDGRLKGSTLVWKRGMSKWVPASEVKELRAFVPDDDQQDTVTKEVQQRVSIGTKAMPTPSIPAPGLGSPTSVSPGNMVDINALRAAGVRGPVNTLVGGMGDKGKGDASPAIPGAPKVPKLDGGWRDGAARRDRDEDTVTALVPGEGESETQRKKKAKKKSLPKKKKTVPPPRKRSGTMPRGKSPSRKPPPIRARPTAPLGGAASVKKTLKPGPPKPKPSVPPPVGSSEVLSDRFNSKKHTQPGRKVPASPGKPEANPRGDSPGGGRRIEAHGPANRRRQSVPMGTPKGAQTGAARSPVAAALGSADTVPGPTALAQKSVPNKAPMAKTGPLPEMDELAAMADQAAKERAHLDQKAPEPPAPSVQPSAPPQQQPAVPQAAAPQAVSQQAASPQVALGAQPTAQPRPPRQPAVSAQPARPLSAPPPPGDMGLAGMSDEAPAPPSMVAGLTLKYPMVAGVIAAAILAIGLSFVVGRVSAPAGGKGPRIAKAREGWAVVPLFARSRASTTPGPRPCLMLRAPSRFAPEATPRIPIEVAEAGGRIAVGFAASRTTARGVLVDPATGKSEMVFTPEVAKDEDRSLERIVPLIKGTETEFGVTTQEAEGMYRSVYAPGETPFVIGFDKENVLKADAPGGTAQRVWSLAEGAGRADALRLTNAEGAGFPLTYRQNKRGDKGFVYYAMMDQGGTIAHQAMPLAAPDGEVGKPNIAAGNGHVSVVFAHRPKVEGARWELRWARGPATEPLTDATLVDIPAGGPGGDAGAPAITPLSGGRWLLMWMEGSRGAWTIRAQTYDRKYRPLGEALRVSPETGNFGQGVVGVVGEKGVVVFLLENAGRYEVWGTVLQCQ